ncbi:MAG: hypothetical protein IT432_00765 [Phycisphaerales bacterium]|nr:hypothetical protein [Phycisphaerales bacterium]
MLDIEEVAQKLRPLLPEQVDRWLSIRRRADEQTARLIDQKILATAARELGDYERRILLSLPPRTESDGPIGLGQVLYAGPRGPMGLLEAEILQHVTIIGRSGAGKTNCLFHILGQLHERGVPFLFLDWKRSARHWAVALDPRPALATPGRPIAPFAFNPFSPPPSLEPRTYLGHIIDIIADAYDLGEGAISVLQRAIRGVYDTGNLSPSPREILDRIHEEKAKGRAAAWTISAVRALESIDAADICGTTRAGQAELVHALMERSTIVELDGLSQNARAMLVPALCLWVYFERLAAPVRERLAQVIVVEEAHQLLRAEGPTRREPVLGMLLRQAREINTGFIVVDQHPSMMSSAALGNSCVTVALNLKDGPDVNRAATLCGLNPREKHLLGVLPVGQAVVRVQSRWRQPVLVLIPLVPVSKGRVTDGDARTWATNPPSQPPRPPRPPEFPPPTAPTGAHSAGSGGSVGTWGGQGRIPVGDGLLSEEALVFLEDVARHPSDGVRVRYHRMGLSGHRGNRLKAQLVSSGWLEQQIVPRGNTRLVVMRPTKDAARSLGLARLEAGEGSIAHEYWRRHAAALLRDAGYRVRIESSRDGVSRGRADVVGVRGSERIAVEVETGRSDAARNARACLRAGFPRVVVLVTHREALPGIERALARAGLLIPVRVTVDVAWAWRPSQPRA